MNAKEAIDAAKTGSEKAFTILYNTYYRSIYNNIYNIVKNKDVADDLASETFLKAFKNIEKFSKDISFEMWLKTIANNHSIDWIRSSARRRNDIYIDNEQLSEFIITDYSNPEKDLIKKEHKSIFDETLNSMAKKPKEILIMRYNDNLTYKEISERLDINIGTVKSYIHKYKQQIISKINQPKKVKHENKSIVVNGDQILS